MPTANQFYENVDLTVLTLRLQILAGAGRHLINERPERALEWCWALVNDGHAFPNHFETPLFKRLKVHPGYAEMITAMKKNASYHLRLIANQ